jgi:hypothetical protein
MSFESTLSMPEGAITRIRSDVDNETGEIEFALS